MRLQFQRARIVACSILLLTSWSTAANAEEPAEKVTLRVVSLKQYTAILKAAKGKVVLVDFWGTTCRPCRTQFPHTVALHKKFAEQGLRVISMACDDEDAHEAALKFLTNSHATFTNLRSALGASDDTYNAYEIDSGALPHYKLYDRSGKLRHTFSVDPTAKKQFTTEEIQAKVEELLEEAH